MSVEFQLPDSMPRSLLVHSGRAIRHAEVIKDTSSRDSLFPKRPLSGELPRVKVKSGKTQGSNSQPKSAIQPEGCRWGIDR